MDLPESTVRFRVVGPDGRPVRGAEVALDRMGIDSFDWVRTETDRAGTCRIPRVYVPWEDTVLVKARGFAMARFHLEELLLVGRRFVVRLEPGRTITGRVLDPAGRPVAGAFLLDGLYPGVFRVSVYPAGTPLASGFPDPGPPLVTVPLEAGTRDRLVTLPGSG